ncbi:hypothetical protein [Phyllobacterium zundukense]|uniref:Uncharacterized protein n=1 Tax=Phyllobacterium zundukense TaxID=1867719 RepID=A0ACD4D9B3_9HYPH|nr:hypothetical protein [Phyllobacterium zundukense]UXN62453.1 hypothetical protein N8E88_20990 [Phyllobacterium zundukense]
MSLKHHGIGGGTVTTYAAFDRYGLVPEKKPDSLRSSEQEPKKGSNLLQLSITPFNLEIRDDWRVYLPRDGKEYSLQKRIYGRWIEQRTAKNAEDLIHGVRLKVGRISGFAESLLEELPPLGVETNPT